jgi:hypothetical protein
MVLMMDTGNKETFDMNTQAYCHDATVMLAAAVVERSADLIRDGWVKGRFYKMIEKNVPVAFCILGALEEALNEVMPTANFAPEARREVHDMCAAFILDEVEEQTRVKTTSIPGWNDSGERSQEEVVSVMQGAAARLWDISLDSNESLADLSKFVSAAAQRGAGLRAQAEASEYSN